MWQEYEKYKQFLRELDLSPDEYEKRVQQIIKEMDDAGKNKIFS